MSTVVVVGLGYVGLPLAMRAAEAGHRVAGYDVDEARVKSLQAGESYIEDVPSGQLKEALQDGMFRPSADVSVCAGFDVAVVAAPTPLRDGLPDLTYLEDSARALSGYLKPGATVVIESTSYPGTTQEKVLPLLEEGSGLVAGRDFHLGFSPERIDPGNTTWTLVTTPKIVSGIDEASLEVIKAFYDTIVDRTVVVSSPREAELAKLVENTFRHVNIALVNELAMYAHDLASTCGRRSRPPRPSRSGSCGSPRGREWAATACPSTRPTFPGGSSGRWARASASSSSPTTSTTTCRTTWCTGS